MPPAREVNFRALYARMQESATEAGSTYRNTLLPWIASHPTARDWLSDVATINAEAISTADSETLTQLYALSRVNDLLLLGFQRPEPTHLGWSITRSEYLEISESLGLKHERASTFCPFYHEIVNVDQTEDDSQPIILEEAYWPCLMLGSMLFSRAGVRVSGGRAFIVKEVAERSTLYWAYIRKNRPHGDLSHGWGHNSQWATHFRRDFAIGGQLHYNVDGRNDLSAVNEDEPGSKTLTRTERLELLVNRCLIKCPKVSNDLWPYEDRCSTVSYA
jgi:hypothetical protein